MYVLRALTGAAAVKLCSRYADCKNVRQDGAVAVSGVSVNEKSVVEFKAIFTKSGIERPARTKESEISGAHRRSE